MCENRSTNHFYQSSGFFKLKIDLVHVINTFPDSYGHGDGG